MRKPVKPKTNYLAKFVPNASFHVYNRTNNLERLFLNDDDRLFFLSQYRRFVSDFVVTYAYCLLPNHFHFAIRVKSVAKLAELVEQVLELDRTIPQQQFLADPINEQNFHALIERQFTRMFTAYSMYFNRRYQRSGNLFYRPFKRVAISDESQLHWLVYYIHYNPRKHGVSENFLGYPWSSYQALVSGMPTNLDRDAVWDLYAGRESFIKFHEGETLSAPYSRDLELED